MSARRARLISNVTIISVINNCGEVVTAFDGTGKKGEMVIDVFGYSAFLESKKNEA